MTPDQLRIQELEKQVNDLVKNQQMLMSIFYNSSPTKLYLKNTIAFDKESLVGFYGATPIKKQSVGADTLANVYIVLRALGIIT